jgi:hypothetical protein
MRVAEPCQKPGYAIQRKVVALGVQRHEARDFAIGEQRRHCQKSYGGVRRQKRALPL